RPNPHKRSKTRSSPTAHPSLRSSAAYHGRWHLDLVCPFHGGEMVRRSALHDSTYTSKIQRTSKHAVTALAAAAIAAGFFASERHVMGASYSGTPYTGTAMAVPGSLPAANFDNGGEGIAYHDNSTGNAGGAFRQTDVDLAASSEGGYTIGWISSGEWVNYTV